MRPVVCLELSPAAGLPGVGPLKMNGRCSYRDPWGGSGSVAMVIELRYGWARSAP
ncbi:hypothetical protein [Frateuria aurantia]|uniref:Uncharacterized protein n=1 Tax=Frateuria aurantia (strain ATCC 33424 / DSM 6220 / KCTC 2777 / LMG 1558 / NBRC 3245 / NCIMB 13370) TaxID=767434 RepID=H8KYW1_FRAAD|nr:hypothetical protein [Frateuria aurantia]AFC86991.1 hypothetical protein Fraau_2648 [Frateuria aurantia DSM 6220]